MEVAGGIELVQCCQIGLLLANWATFISTWLQKMWVGDLRLFGLLLILNWATSLFLGYVVFSYKLFWIESLVVSWKRGTKRSHHVCAAHSA